jgi:hypothetical protein
MRNNLDASSNLNYSTELQQVSLPSISGNPPFIYLKVKCTYLNIYSFDLSQIQIFIVFFLIQISLSSLLK